MSLPRERKNRRSFARSFDIGLYFSILILAAVPFVDYFWFFIPSATALLLKRKSRLITVLSFLLGSLSLVRWNSQWPDLEKLSFFLLFVEGYLLYRYRRRRLSAGLLIFWPLALSSLIAFILFVVSFSDFETWTAAQLSSEILPYFLRPSAWNEVSLGLYKSILLPIFTKGLFAVFGGMLGMSMLMNGILVSILDGLKSKMPFRLPGFLWNSFHSFKSPDSVLALLVAGLTCVAYADYIHKPAFQILSILGWNLSLAALVPIFLQGLALMTFMLGRAGIFPSVLIVFALLVNPLPVLVVAGLGDLWFDFRSRIRSNPNYKDG